jgi:diguanylate cyclase (GGDEF)-like protein
MAPAEHHSGLMNYIPARAVPLLLIVGGAILLAIAGGYEIVRELHAWAARGGPLPSSLMLHVLVVAAALLLGAAMVLLRRAQSELRVASLKLERDAQHLAFLAHHDALTGLPNRAMFADRAREAVAHARRHAKSAAFLFLDLDRFKAVNDHFGHAVGDELLRAIAARLRAAVRSDDFVARIGGDEFCVLLQDIAAPREAAAVADKLLHELGQAYRVGEHGIACGASIGIACVPRDGDDVATLLRLADAAMYRVKSRGRNGYQFVSPSSEDCHAAPARVA